MLFPKKLPHILLQILAMIHKDTIAKIHFLKKSQYHNLQDRIDADQLEKKYGGTLPDLTEFW